MAKHEQFDLASPPRMMEAAVEETELAPAVDMYENEESIILFADLPGVEPARIEYRVEAGILYISGQVTPPLETGGGWQIFHQEFTHRTYRRTVRLPAGIKPAPITMTFRDGIVELSIPKASVSHPEVEKDSNS